MEQLGAFVKSENWTSDFCHQIRNTFFVSWKILIVAVIVVSSCFVELEALLIFSSLVLCQMLECVIMWFY